MQFDGRTAMASLVALVLLLCALSTAAWWTRRRYRGFGRWTLAGIALVLALLLLSLRPRAPDWVTMLSANAVIALAAILYLEGAREFRGLPPRRWLAYAGGVVAIGVLVFFLYIRPNLNARAAVISAFLAIMFLLTAMTLLRAIPSVHTFGLRLTGSLFALAGVLNLARAAYSIFGPRVQDLFASSGLSRAFFIGTAGQLAFLPVGFMFLADERVISDLLDAKERARRADAEAMQQAREKGDLSTLSGRLMEAQEQERARIARELHDDLAQQAAALSVHLHDVLHLLPPGTNEHVRIKQICDQTNELARGIQVVAQSLHSAKLELLGLPSAAAGLCRELSTRHRVPIDFSAEDVPGNLSKPTALCLFRVLQEALSNALKHGGGSSVTVTLRGTLTDVHLAVIDSGVGFDPNTTSQSRGLGLISMKERLNLVEGTLRVESHLGAGTTVRVRVPLGTQA
jgi:signal transduction histidine kinase